MADRIVATSTTDPLEAVHAALGVTPAADAAPPAAPATEAAPEAAPPAEPTETPAVKAEDPADDESGDDDADDAATEVDDDAASEAARTLNARKVYRNKAEKRISALTKEKSEARAEAERWRKRAEELEAKSKPAAETPPAPPAEPKVETPAATFDKPRPKQDDFPDYEAYELARDAWVEEKTLFAAEQRQAAREQAAAEARAKAEQEAAARQAQEAFAGRMDKAREVIDDFDEVVQAQGTLMMHGDVIAYIKESETGPELLYHLAKHVDVAKKLSQMSPAKALIELGKIEAAMSAAPAAAPEKPAEKPAPRPRPVPVSKAPPPVATVGAGSVAKAKSIADENLSFKEYDAMRTAEEQRRRSA